MSDIKTKPATKEYRDNWDRIFKKTKFHKWDDIKHRGMTPERIAEREKALARELEELERSK